MDVALSKGKLEKAAHYKELLDKAEEAKKRHEKIKFAEECEVSITTLNRIRYRYEEEGFLGLIDKRNGNPDRNKELVGLVKKAKKEKMMETEVLDYRSPLYGRRTGQWKVEPLNFFELGEFFPHYSAEEIVKVYATLDAIPGYLVKFDHDVSVETRVDKSIVSKYLSILENLHIVEKAFTIIATGKTITTINGWTHQKSSQHQPKTPF